VGFLLSDIIIKMKNEVENTIDNKPEDKILIFDFDGTIADSLDTTVNIYNKLVGEYHRSPITKDNLAHMRSMSVIDCIRYMHFPLMRLPFVMSRAKKEFSKMVAGVKPVEGIREVLVSLKGKGYKLFVLSSNSKENIETFLKNNAIDVFEEVYSVTNIFGKGSLIKKLVADNHWDKSCVVYIGDEVRDIHAAQKAGVKSAAVTWGYNTEEFLKKENPDFILRNISEINDL
jgi:phosphoglycolate phosphatase